MRKSQAESKSPSTTLDDSVAALDISSGSGSPGDDVIVGGLGTDLMFGQGRRDWFSWASTQKASLDRVLDFAAGPGGDVIYLAGAGFAGMSFASFMSAYVREADGSTIIDFDGSFGSTLQIDLYGIAKIALVFQLYPDGSVSRPGIPYKKLGADEELNALFVKAAVSMLEKCTPLELPVDLRPLRFTISKNKWSVRFTIG